MGYYPLFLRLRGCPCLVVGGGPVGERKVRGLLQAEARVTVVSPRVTPGLAQLAREGRLQWRPRRYRPRDLRGMVLVFVASGDRRLNSRIADHCRRAGIWVNVADSPEESSFLVPAVVRRGQLQIAVSTGGNSPALAAFLKRRLEEDIGREYNSLLTFLGELRPWLKKILPDDQKKRAGAFRRLVADRVLWELVARGDRKAARERVAECISEQWD
ncbi:precorrin-2 dehydrogenase/sirohydrochlorin ferrochelatase family protein [Thermanaeromonas sp. C210]|uniref:precorrin-2 dehydrogenase/sirohydrochlorin ferrochelatase family protein n=1 Tax=Thermanaeromonas sp. C210 TaxID=2731925 RepID=UPI0021102AD5|nr:bifunctional precorrin-2 dehydrogenase/sirohydrochlorin ferrochelatase [Thermanaeromonas sp. C210]